MAHVRTSKINGTPLQHPSIAPEIRPETMRLLDELALEPRWKKYLENAPQHLLLAMVRRYRELSDWGRQTMRDFPPGYYTDGAGDLVSVAAIVEISETTHVGQGLRFYRTRTPAIEMSLPLAELVWLGHEFPDHLGWRR